MPPEKNQVKFRCSDHFLQRIKSECLKRHMTVQDMVSRALRLYFQTTPPPGWKRVPKDADPEGHVTLTLNVVPFDDPERLDWAEVWFRYVEEMPREKTLFHVEVLKLDLMNYRSSRRKADLRKSQKAGKERSGVQTRAE